MLIWAGRNGPLILIAGLVAGVTLPRLSAMLLPWLWAMVSLLLFLAALRIGTDAFALTRRNLAQSLGAVLALQVLVPLAVLAFGLIGLVPEAALLALVLMFAAPSIMSSANLCLMMGLPAAHAMQLMVLGTALVPLTAIPVLTALWGTHLLAEVALVSVRLLLVIGVAVGAGLLVRATLWKTPSHTQSARLDGASALGLAVFVVALMGPVRGLIDAGGSALWLWMGLAFGANLGAQILAWAVLRRRPRAVRGPVAIIAGNRNVSLFLVALPPEILAPALAFIGCYQIPMYLTPTLMRWLYADKP